MKRLIMFILAALMLETAGFCKNLDDIYSKPFITDIIGKVNEYQFNHPWRETDDIWIRGTYYTGVMACYQATGDQALLDQCNAWGEKLNWQIPTLEPDNKNSGVNLLTCAQTWLESYMIEPNQKKIRPLLSHLKNPQIRNAVSRPLIWYHARGRRYVDGLYTGPPTLAMLHQVTGDDKYLDWMNACFWDVYGALFDRDKDLFYRDIRYMPGHTDPVEAKLVRPDSITHEEARRSYVYQQTKNNQKVLWSRGNGWALAGIARILKYLPLDHPNTQAYTQVYKNMAAALKQCQQSEGYWTPNLADSEDYATKESSGTGFFTYGLAWGINQGILCEEDYLPVVRKSWAALVSMVDKDGKVQWGQLVGSGPYQVREKDFHEYVTGTFLLAASEMFRLAD